MKKIISLTFCTLFGLSLIAQVNGPAKERIAAKRVEFYNKELQLSGEESKAFWAIFNEYEKEKEHMKKEFQKDNKPELMSDAEMEDFLDRRFDAEIAQIELKRTYYHKLKKVISVRKLAMLPRVENKFKRALLQQTRKARN